MHYKGVYSSSSGTKTNESVKKTSDLHICGASAKCVRTLRKTHRRIALFFIIFIFTTLIGHLYNIPSKLQQAIKVTKPS